VDVLGETLRAFDVDTAQHAVAGNVGEDDGFAAFIFEPFGDVEHVVAAGLAPAVGGHLAIACIQANNDMAVEYAAGVTQEGRVLDGSRTDDRVRDAQVKIGFDGVEIADAAPYLDGNAFVDGLHNGPDGGCILGLACHCPIEVHQVQAPCALFYPLRCHGPGI